MLETQRSYTIGYLLGIGGCMDVLLYLGFCRFGRFVGSRVVILLCNLKLFEFIFKFVVLGWMSYVALLFIINNQCCAL